MKMLSKKILGFLFAVSSILTLSLQATHNVSRYFPFLERPEDYVIKNRSHFTPTFFYLDATTAFRRGGGTGGVPELWGKYDLKDVIASLEAVDPTADPVRDVTGGDTYSNKSMQFGIRGKTQGVGVGLGYEHTFKWLGLQAGVWIPVVALGTQSRFSFNRNDSASFFRYPDNEQDLSQKEQVADKIRRVTHDIIGFEENLWNKTGFGDLDVHLRWNLHLDHIFMMRSLDFNVQGGAIVPTGFKSDMNIPCSLSIGSNGHWGLYGDLVTALELRQDWTFGLMFGGVHLFPHSRTVRIPVGNEPAIFSSLVGRVRMEPGFTFKFSPYFTLSNLSDGLDFQARYTYLRHNMDHWEDERSDKTVQCYLDKGSLVGQKETLSKWRAHYITLQLLYDTKEAMKHMSLTPVFFVGYDFPLNGNGIAKMRQFYVGAELHF